MDKFKELAEITAAIRARLNSQARARAAIEKIVNQAREEFTDDESFDKWKSDILDEELWEDD